MRCFSAWLAFVCLLVVSVAQAHKSSDAYVHLTGGGSNGVSLRVDVALRDLDVALDLDTNGDGKLTWGEVREAWPAIEAYIHARIQLEGCPLPAATRTLERRIDGVYAALQWQTGCQPVKGPAIRYSVLAEIDPTHRGIARIEWARSAPALRVLVPQAGVIEGPTLPGETGGGRTTAVAAQTAKPVDAAENDTLAFLREGMRHILTGYDHVLFLICLLLPSVMRRTATGWKPVDRLSQAVWPVLGVVTSFTIAHSITLALAATATVSLSPAFIEPAIAVTIILAALDNLRPIFGGRRALITFAFGLIHGFGFAGVLLELHLPPRQFAWALLQFNAGLEMGQLLVVGVALSLLYRLRRAAKYPRWVIGAGSVVAITIATLWLVQRTANVSLLPG
jgi:hypothetical protein